MYRSILILVALSTSGSVWARVFSPRIVSPHNADAYSMKTFARFGRWADLRGDQRAWEIYKYLVDKRSGLFHMNEVLEGEDVLSEYRTVRDPVKIINVYGYGYCGIFGPVMAGVCEGAGIGRARTLILSDWRHVATEAFYDDKWHYLDIDVRSVFRRSDGRLASMAEAQRESALWTGRGPLFFPNDPLDSTRKVYQQTPVHYHHGYYQSGHTMDYVLRKGESFTRWWTPQGGRWHHAEAYHRLEWLRKLIEKEPRGPAPNHRHFTIHNYGNGRFVYQPDLTERSSDFFDGVWEAENVRPTADGLSLIEPGRGSAVFEVRSPYVIVPKVGKLETTEDDCEASIVEIDAVGASLSISMDGGLSWEQLKTERQSATLDLTRQVSGDYGYLLKIALAGQPGGASVRRLRITTWVQVASASLPSLRKGKNLIEYRTGDHYGLPTRVVEIRCSAGTPQELLKHLIAPPEDYDPARRTSRVRGAMVAKIQAPPGAKIAWFSAGASFQTYRNAEAQRTRNTMAYAVEKPENFVEIYRAHVPTYHYHWHYNADREVMLAKPAGVVYVRYVGDPAVNSVRLYAHCLDDRAGRESPVLIRHVWTEDGRRKSRRVRLDKPAGYEITAGSDPVDESLEISVPSDRRR